MSGAGVAGAVTSKWSKGSGGPAGDECYNLTVAETLTAGCRKSDRGDVPNLAIAFGAQAESPFVEECALTVTGRKGDPGMIVFDSAQVTNPNNRSDPQPGDACHSLAAKGHPPAVAFRAVQDGFDVGPISPPLAHTDGGGAGVPTIAFQERGRPNGRELEISGEVAYSINAGIGGGRTSEGRILTPRYQVRRLTPLECERLQGFADGYTLIDYRGRKAKDTPRYQALGNSMAVNCMRLLGNRIAAVEILIASSLLSAPSRGARARRA